MNPRRSLPWFYAFVLLTIALGSTLSSLAQTPLTPAVIDKSSLFVSAPALHLSGAPASIVAGDINSDGKLDLITSDAKSGKVTVSLGLGNGEFAAGVAFSAGDRPGALALVDLNGDGRLDLVVANAAAVSILSGNGAGGFQAPVTYPLSFHPSLLAAGDFRGQGRADLIVADSASAHIALLANDGQGRYAAPALQAVNAIPSALAVIPGSSHADLAIAYANGSLNILHGGSAALAASAPIALANQPISAIFAGDFNHDGQPDLAVTIPGKQQLSILLAQSDNRFASPISYHVSSNPQALLSADIDEDGNADLIVANQGSNTFSLLRGNGDGSFAAAKDFITGRGPIAAVTGDFYQAGHLDLAILNHDDATISIPRNAGDGAFLAARAYSVSQQPRAVASADLTGSHRADLVVTSSCSSDSCAHGAASVLLAQQDGSYHLAGSYPLGSAPVAIALGDLDGGKNPSLLALNRGDKTLSILPGLGNGRFQQQPITLSLAAAPIAFAIADLNHDGKPDLAIIGDCGTDHCSQPGTLEIFYGSASGFRAGPAYPLGYAPSSLAIADLNGDKKLDILVANRCGASASCTASGTASLFFGAAQERFTPGPSIDLGSSPSSIALADLGSRGVSDLVVAHASDNSVTTLRGNGDGSFQPATRYAAGSAPNSLAIADFNGDGHLDVAVSNHTDATVSVFYGKGDGSLASPSTFSVGAGPASLTLLSASSKLHAGLVTANADAANTAGDQVSVLLNFQPEGVGANATTTTIAASPTSATVGDAVTLTATVTGSAMIGAPTGSVAFDSLPDAIADCNGSASNTVSPGTAVASSTTYACITHTLQATSQSVNASYSGDANYDTSSSDTPASVTIAPYTTATLALTPSASSVNVNGSTTFTASLTGLPAAGPAPSGTVQFKINGFINTNVCPDEPISGTPACTTNTLTVGHGSVTASYTADPNYTVAAPKTSTVTVNALTGALSLGVSANPTVGANVTITVSIPNTTVITPTAPTASPAFLVNGVAPGGSGPLSQCGALVFNAAAYNWTCTTVFPKAQTYNITVSYPSSDPNFTFTSASQSINISPSAAVSLALAASPASAYVNQSVTYTATLTLKAPGAGAPAPTGTVTFTDITDNLHPVPLSCSPAVISTKAGVTAATCLSDAYAHSSTGVTIQAVYQGDSYYAQGANNKTTVQILADPTVTTVSPAFPSPSQVNQSVQLSAVVAATSVVTNPTGKATPQGKVVFSVTPTGGNAAKACEDDSLTSGNALCNYTFTAAGTYVITAAYTSSDTTQFGDSTSDSSRTQTVDSVGTTIKISPGSNTLAINDKMTFSSTIVFSNTPPTGKVTYTDNSVHSGQTNGLNLCVVDVNADGSVPDCPASFSFAGQHAVTASYSGDGNYKSATSQVSSVVVNPGSVVVNGPTYSGAPAVNQTTTLSATIVQTAFTGAPNYTPIYPDGSVSFNYIVKVGDTPVFLCSGDVTPGNGSTPSTASCPAAFPKAITYTLIANYSPSAAKNFAAASNKSSPQITIKQSATTTAFTSQSPLTASVYEPLTLYAMVTPANAGVTLPTHTVTFTFDKSPLTCSATVSSDGTAFCSLPANAGIAVAGAYKVTAVYSGDDNFVTSSATQSLTVQPDPMTGSLVSNSANNTIIATQQVTFTASFTPQFQPTPSEAPPVGGIAFIVGATANSAGSPVNCDPKSSTASAWAGGALTATCTYISLSGDQGPYNITAQYLPTGASLNNFTTPIPSLAETIQNFTLTVTPSPSTAIYVTQGFSTNPQASTENPDPFTGILNPALSATITGIAGLNDSVSIDCILTLPGSASTTKKPGCSPASSLVSVTAAAPSATTPASSGGFDFATTLATTPGTYQITLRATDTSATGLVHSSPTASGSNPYTGITLYVVPQAGEITLSAGFSGTETVNFPTPNSLTFASNACPVILFTADITKPAWKKTTGSNITCAAASNGLVNGLTQATVKITTTGPGQNASLRHSSAVALAALAGAPVLAVLTFFLAGRSRRRGALRFFALLLLLAGIGNAVACGGGGFNITPTQPAGTTYGSYLIQVTGTDSTGASYFAVVPLTVPAPTTTTN